MKVLVIDKIILLIISTLVFTMALKELLIYQDQHPRLNNIIWRMMFPAYIGLIITGSMNFYVKTLPNLIQHIENLSWVVFVCSSLVYGLVLYTLKLKLTVDESSNS